MKICFFNLNAYSVFNEGSGAPIGGTEVQLKNLADYFSQQPGFDVTFLTGNWGQPSVECYSNIVVVSTISLEKKLMNYIVAPFGIWQALKKVSADVYIASSASLEIGILAFFCFIYKKKFIYRTAHEMDYSGEFIRKHFLSGKFFSYGLRHASRVVVQSNNAQKRLKQQGILSVAIPNGYPLQMPVDQQKQLEGGSILWVARCEDWKGPSIFLDIAERFPDEIFVMISPKQAHDKGLFENILERAQQLHNVRFIESVPFGDIQDFFNKAKIFINTSESEGFPNTYLQACIGKTPIISLKVNPDNFIVENNIGYCADGDFDFMIKLIEKMINDKADWLEKSKNSLKYVLKHHNINRIGSRWKSVLDGMFTTGL